MLRKSLFLPLMAAAIGGPLLFLSEGSNTDSGNESGDELAVGMSLASLDSSQKPIYRADQNLDEVLDFRLTPRAIENRWENVTKSALADRQIFRTSMLSGHGPTDPVGALTYEFDFKGLLRSIRFSGLVEDPRPFIGFVGGKFGFAKTDSQGNEYRPTAFSGYTGLMRLSPSPAEKNQLLIELTIER